MRRIRKQMVDREFSNEIPSAKQHSCPPLLVLLNLQEALHFLLVKWTVAFLFTEKKWLWNCFQNLDITIKGKLSYGIKQRRAMWHASYINPNTEHFFWQSFFVMQPF
jgi:hypothetical protein